MVSQNNKKTIQKISILWYIKIIQQYIPRFVPPSLSLLRKNSCKCVFYPEMQSFVDICMSNTI